MTKLLVGSHLKYNWLQNSIYVMVYAAVVGFYKVALSIAMEIQVTAGAGMMAIGLLYGIMILSVMFKMQILTNRNLWYTYHELGMTGKEAARIIMIEDAIRMYSGDYFGKSDDSSFISVYHKYSFIRFAGDTMYHNSFSGSVLSANSILIFTYMA